LPDTTFVARLVHGSGALPRGVMAVLKRLGLAGVSHHTVARYVEARDAGGLTGE